MPPARSRPSAQFQFNFGPRTVFWNTASGDFSAGGNWDVGFAPRSIDTAAIQNGGISTLSTKLSATPSAVWVGDDASTSGTLALTPGGALTCGALVLGQSGGSGALVLGGGTLVTASITEGAGGSGILDFNGGTLQASGSSAEFLNGLSAAYIQAGGATINTGGYAVLIGQSLAHDPALETTSDGGLTKIGTGTLVLSGTDNTYTGGTDILDGTLEVTSAAALADGSLTVSAAGVFVFDPTIAAGPAAGETLAGRTALGVAAAPVPEPGGLALLAAGLLAGLGAWRRQ